MLEHQKIVLNGVQNNKQLFRKELIKSLAWMNPEELTKLRLWVRDKFYHKHSDVINEILYAKYEYV